MSKIPLIFIFVSALFARHAWCVGPKLNLVIRESKILFMSKVDSFDLDLEENKLPCANQDYWHASHETLYLGWDKDQFELGNENVEDLQNRNYIFARCRNTLTEVLAWFPHERKYEFSVTEQLLHKNYVPQKLPLLLRKTSLVDGKISFYSCQSGFTKTLIKETEKYILYSIELSCEKTSKPNSMITGPLDFVTDPGPFATELSYYGPVLPAVSSQTKSMNSAVKSFIKYIPFGKYNGVMSTLSKKCSIEFYRQNSQLVLIHKTLSSNRGRRLELKAENLLGFVEGNLYQSPFKVEGNPVGKFAAAEFLDLKSSHGSIIVRFEKNDTLEGQIVRINGGEIYCRRLKVSNH